jgi:hypothetical protein
MPDVSSSTFNVNVSALSDMFSIFEVRHSPEIAWAPRTALALAYSNHTGLANDRLGARVSTVGELKCGAISIDRNRQS